MAVSVIEVFTMALFDGFITILFPLCTVFLILCSFFNLPMNILSTLMIKNQTNRIFCLVFGYLPIVCLFYA